MARKSGKKINSKRSKPDHYSERARSQGYLARSVYKLEEIQQKFSVIRPGGVYLDMGAAPGSWSQFMMRTFGSKIKLMSVDIQEMKFHGPDDSHYVLIGDMFNRKVQKEIADFGPYDAMLSDAAPSTMGNKTVDTLASAGMAEHLIFLGDQYIKTGGNLVIKIFRGGEEQNLLKMLRERYEIAKLFKPNSCRKESFESFLVGVGRK